LKFKLRSGFRKIEHDALGRIAVWPECSTNFSRSPSRRTPSFRILSSIVDLTTWRYDRIHLIARFRKNQPAPLIEYGAAAFASVNPALRRLPSR
jgi:hypothetical protein